LSNLTRVAVLTTGRQDYGILRSTLKLLACEPDFELLLLVGGMHLSSRYGRTVTKVEADGFEIAAALDWLGDGVDGEASIQAQTGEVVRMVSDSLSKFSPDFLILVGDRYETAAAALAAVLGRVPVVHLHGGEETEGSLDNQLRHAITKLSHLHLVSHPVHASRVIQMGENPDSVHVVGAPGLDNLFRADLPDKAALEEKIGMELKPPVVIVTLHPVTAKPEETSHVLSALTLAMTAVEVTYVITLPNADLGNDEICTSLSSWGVGRERVRLVESLGEQAYFGLMRLADAMVGNSSSGMIEAGVYQLPVVDIGSRQGGRLRGSNVIHVEPGESAVQAALVQSLSKEFRSGLSGTSSPYGDGKSGQRILDVLKHWSPPTSTCKIFHPFNLPPTRQ